MSAGYSQESQNLLQQYLDAELHETEQSRLFAELSVNEALRRDYNAMMAVRDELRRDLITPPVVVESDVIAAMTALQPLPAATLMSLRVKSALFGVSAGIALTLLFFWFNGVTPNSISDHGVLTADAQKNIQRQTPNAPSISEISESNNQRNSTNSVATETSSTTSSNTSSTSNTGSSSLTKYNGTSNSTLSQSGSSTKGVEHQPNTAASSSHSSQSSHIGRAHTKSSQYPLPNSSHITGTARSAGSNKESLAENGTHTINRRSNEKLLSRAAHSGRDQRASTQNNGSESRTSNNVLSEATAHQGGVTSDEPNATESRSSATASDVSRSAGTASSSASSTTSSTASSTASSVASSETKVQSAKSPNSLASSQSSTSTVPSQSIAAASGSVAPSTARSEPAASHTPDLSGADATSLGQMSHEAPHQRRLAMEFRSFAMRSYPDISLTSLSQPPINNVALSLMRSMADEHSVGIEIGQESILQQYSATMNARPVSVEQNTLAWWLSALYEYAPLALRSGDLQPYGRVTFGATRIGPIGRLLVGARYYVLENIGIMVNAEGMQLMSWQNGNSVSSSKLGLSGGLSIRF